jgi:hypothetical protein
VEPTDGGILGWPCAPPRSTCALDYPGPQVAGHCVRVANVARVTHVARAPDSPCRTVYQQGTCCPRCPLPRECTVSMLCFSPGLSMTEKKVKASAPPQRSAAAPFCFTCSFAGGIRPAGPLDDFRSNGTLRMGIFVANGKQFCTKIRRLLVFRMPIRNVPVSIRYICVSKKHEGRNLTFVQAKWGRPNQELALHPRLPGLAQQWIFRASSGFFWWILYGPGLAQQWIFLVDFVLVVGS